MIIPNIRRFKEILILLAGILLSGSAAIAGPKVVWSELRADQASTIDLESDEQSTLELEGDNYASGFVSPAIAVNDSTGQVLSTYTAFENDTLTEFIVRMDMSGNNIERLVSLSGDGESIHTLAVSESESRIYWIESAETSQGTVRFKTSNSSGGNIQTIDTVSGGGYIDGVVVDDQRGKILYIKSDGSTTEVIRANLDGSGKETAVNGFFIALSDLALHVESNTLFWTLAGWKGVNQVQLDENTMVEAFDALTLFEDSTAQPLREVLVSQSGNGKLVYISDGNLMTRNLDGSDEKIVTEVTTGVTLAVNDEANGGNEDSDFISYFGEVTEEDGDWVFVDWFGSGWVYGENFPWMFHVDHGWIVAASSPGNRIWFRDSVYGLLTISSRAPHYYWSFQMQTWLYHQQDTSKSDGGRWFYNHSESRWELEGDAPG